MCLMDRHIGKIERSPRCNQCNQCNQCDKTKSKIRSRRRTRTNFASSLVGYAMQVVDEMIEKYGCIPTIEQLTSFPHWVAAVDCKDAWSVARVLKLDKITQENPDMILCKTTYNFELEYPNWGREPRDSLTLNPEDPPDKHRIAPIEECILEQGALFRNIPSQKHESSLLFGTPTARRHTRVSCYISTHQQTLKGIHLWSMGIMNVDGNITTGYYSHARHVPLRFKPNTIWITSPVSTRRRREMTMSLIFEKLNQTILCQARARREEERKISRKRKREIGRGSKIVLNELTLRFLKSKPRHVSKSCMAFKRGWVNTYGKPVKWGFSDKTTGPEVPSHLVQLISTWCSGADLVRWACVDRKTQVDLISFKFIFNQCAFISSRENEQQMTVGGICRALRDLKNKKIEQESTAWTDAGGSKASTFFRDLADKIESLEKKIEEQEKKFNVWHPRLVRTREKRRALELFL